MLPRNPLTDFLRWFLIPLIFGADAPDAAVVVEDDTLDEDLEESCLVAAPLLFLLVVGPEEPCTGVTMYLSLRIILSCRFTSFTSLNLQLHFSDRFNLTNCRAGVF